MDRGTLSRERDGRQKFVLAMDEGKEEENKNADENVETLSLVKARERVIECEGSHRRRKGKNRKWSMRRSKNPAMPRTEFDSALSVRRRGREEITKKSALRS